MPFQEMDVISKKALSFRLTPALTPNLQKDLVAALDTEVSRFRAAVLADLEEGTDPVEAIKIDKLVSLKPKSPDVFVQIHL
jgi:hypothetical protein